MIIFGTRGITTTPETGEFFCPTCERRTSYGRKRVRRFFTLYFIPVIPLDMLGEYIECVSCKDTYNDNVLNYVPDEQQQRIEAEYLIAIKKVMIHMLLADGVIADEEVESVRNIYQQVVGIELTTGQVHEEIETVKKSNEQLSHYVVNLQAVLNDQGKETVLKAALFVAYSDGEFHAQEQALIAEIGVQLGMSKTHIEAVVSDA